MRTERCGVDVRRGGPEAPRWETLDMITYMLSAVGGQAWWRQSVSDVPATRTDVSSLSQSLEDLIAGLSLSSGDICRPRQALILDVFNEVSAAARARMVHRTVACRGQQQGGGHPPVAAFCVLPSVPRSAHQTAVLGLP